MAERSMAFPRERIAELNRHLLPSVDVLHRRGRN
jgi:hypothetical protein